jgi:FkbM family methyltransferase
MKELKNLHNVSPHGVLHVGAHEAEEALEYIENGFQKNGKIIWIEAQENLALDLTRKLDPKIHQVICAAAWDKNDEELEFNITSKDASSSLLPLGKHAERYPSITVEKKVKIRTSRLDSVLPSDAQFNFLVLDIQGAELRAIEGLGSYLNGVNWIFTEVSKEELFVGSSLIDEFDSRLGELGFRRVFTEWDRKAGWGDALYARKEMYKTTHAQKILKNLSWIRRQVRSYIPQWIFPIVVGAKNRIWK